MKVGLSCVFLAFLFPCVSANAQPQPADELVAHARQVTFEQGARVALPEFERALVLYQKARNQHGEARNSHQNGDDQRPVRDYGM